MRLSIWIRQGHRWTSIAFTLTVVANFAVMAVRTPPAWIVYSPLPFLFLLLGSGLYMFAQPYMTGRRRSAPRKTALDG